MKPLAIIVFISYLLFSSCEPRTGILVAQILEPNKSTFEPDVYRIDTNSHWLVKEALLKGPKLAPNYKVRNCVQFMTDLLNPSYHFTQAEKDAIYIKNVSIKEVEKAVRNKDSSQISGICKVLVDKGLANWVSASDSLKPGDIVQYWFQFGGEPMIGHTGIIGEANNRVFHLISSGYSHNGFGFRYGTEDWCQALFVVRIKE